MLQNAKRGGESRESERDWACSLLERETQILETMKFSLALPLLFASVSATPICDDAQRSSFPKFCDLLDLASSNEASLADDLFALPWAAIQKELDVEAVEERRLEEGESALPIVVAHGM